MPETRSVEEIFRDLRDLCREPGFLHALSVIKFRDFYALTDDQGALNLNPDGGYRYSRSRLNNNELMLLIGLLTRSDRPDVFEEGADTPVLVSRADQLLEEFHTHLETPMRQALQTLHAPDHNLYDFGDFAKEAIYYGADSAFPSQYRRFARERYRHDFEWLLATTGISIKSIVEIAQYIVYCVDTQLNSLLASYRARGEVPSAPALTAALIVSKTHLSSRFRGKSASFLKLFSTPIHNGNPSFTDPFAFNEVNARPLLDIGQYLYVANEYKLFESIYESPYYWMLQDTKYAATAARNRGKFLEYQVTKMARQVFGDDRVFANAIFKRPDGSIAAEADVLVVYGEFILVLQAKSKRLTLEARAGVTQKLREDFRSSVQTAYNQAIKFIDLTISGNECEVSAKLRRSFRSLSRAYPIVVLSDHFPSLTILTRHLVQEHKDWPPIIVDLFFLDVLCQLLHHPVDIIYYLRQRARFFNQIWTDSEFNLLGFHMRQKLYVGEDIDFMMVDRDFGAELSDYFVAKEAGAATSVRFLPLEERVGEPAIRALLSALKAGPPEVAGTAIELLDFSEEALRGIAGQIATVRAEVRAGKRFKAFSIETSHGGLSYVALRIVDERAKRVVEMIARKHKYKRRKDRWYAVMDYVDSPMVADEILVILEQWEDSDDTRKYVEDIGPLFKETESSVGTGTR